MLARVEPAHSKLICRNTAHRDENTEPIFKTHNSHASVELARVLPAEAGRQPAATTKELQTLVETIEDLSKPGIVFQIGVEPSRIVILTAISGLDFNRAWDRRITIEIDGLCINVLGRADLILNKRASGRPKDLVDADTLDPRNT